MVLFQLNVSQAWGVIASVFIITMPLVNEILEIKGALKDRKIKEKEMKEKEIPKQNPLDLVICNALEEDDEQSKIGKKTNIIHNNTETLKEESLSISVL